jgi:hypothetical protein
VTPVGADRRLQELVRVTRVAEDEYATTELADVRFIPLVAAEGWIAHEKRTAHASDGPLARAIAKSSEKSYVDRLRESPADVAENQQHTSVRSTVQE